MRKRTRGSHKGDERKSGAIRMMPFARSSSLNLSPPPLLRRGTVFLLSTLVSAKIIERSFLPAQGNEEAKIPTRLDSSDSRGIVSRLNKTRDKSVMF